MLPEEELLRQAAGQGAVAERMGLTPDWIISTGAFMVFQLPVSVGLLDDITARHSTANVLMSYSYCSSCLCECSQDDQATKTIGAVPCVPIKGAMPMLTHSGRTASQSPSSVSLSPVSWGPQKLDDSFPNHRALYALQRPTADQPYIAGLLDPACNNKLEPNIPAEVLYDKKDDGLDPKNSWKGYHVLL